eukprot:TRINITY_DN13318_c0_g2_i1.p1 TRINITY_DN13318_c0_g2~~TRINITY_DN13318_c0_g2_i1.p1  ORF type:complete len:313 (-),score=-0.76 TRINITY_DN13318_c0_g2_i1:129-1067(-)
MNIRAKNSHQEISSIEFPYTWSNISEGKDHDGLLFSNEVVSLVLSAVVSATDPDSSLLATMYAFDIALKKGAIQESEHEFFWKYYDLNVNFIERERLMKELLEIYPEFKSSISDFVNDTLASKITKSKMQSLSLIKQVNMGVASRSDELKSCLDQFVKAQLANTASNYTGPMRLKQFIEMMHLPIPILIRSSSPIDIVSVLTHTANSSGTFLKILRVDSVPRTKEGDLYESVKSSALKGDWVLVRSTYWSFINNLSRDLLSERKIASSFRFLIDGTFSEEASLDKGIVLHTTKKDDRIYADIWEEYANEYPT